MQYAAFLETVSFEILSVAHSWRKDKNIAPTWLDQWYLTACVQINPSQNVVQRGSFVKLELQAGEAELGLRGRAC